MNEVFLIGKVITDIEFNFIINSKKKKSVTVFRILTHDNQNIKIIAYNGIADFVYRNVKQGDDVFVYGNLKNYKVIVVEVNKIQYKNQ